MSSEYETLKIKYDAMLRERDELRTEFDEYKQLSCKSSYEQGLFTGELIKDRDALKAERDELKQKQDNHLPCVSEEAYLSLINERDILKAERDETNIALERHWSDAIDARKDRDAWRAMCEQLAGALEPIRPSLWAFDKNDPESYICDPPKNREFRFHAVEIMKDEGIALIEALSTFEAFKRGRGEK